MKREELEAAGVDVEDGLGRVLGNEQLYERLLGIFAQDTSYDELARAMERGDDDAARAAAHTLKGAAANLSMKTRAELAMGVLTALRAGDRAEAERLMPALADARAAVLRAIG